MKTCPRCRMAPYWHYASNSSHAEKRDLWMMAGCDHVGLFDHEKVLCDHERRIQRAADWDKYAETMFATLTARWQEGPRAAFRAKLWPPVLPSVPNKLFHPMTDGTELPQFHHAEADNPLAE